MNKLKEYKEIIFNLIKLSLPIFGGNISQVLVSFADTAVAGHYSTVALGAISVASAIVMTLTIGAIGLILSISPTIANLRGQNIPSKKYFKLTLFFSIAVSIPFFLILELFLYNIKYIGLSPDLIEPVKQYIAICAWTIFPVAVFTALKEFLQAFEKVVFANILMIVMVVLNIILNIVLTFGIDCFCVHIAPMGVVGLSLATLISKTLVCVFMLIYCVPLFNTIFEKSKKYLKELIRIGTPISFAIFFEFLGFNISGVIIGKFSALYAAVHNVILCIANFTFMIVLSVSSAASIKVGYFNGKGDKQNIIKYSIAEIILTLLICIIAFILLKFFADGIISLFSKDIEVINLSKKILIIAMCFLFFDGIQGACVGILKGLKDTKIIMHTMFFVYLFVAIPIGCYLAFCKNIVLEGFWIGLALALFLAALITSTRVISDIRKMD